MGRMNTMALIVICVVLLFHFAGLLSGSPSGTGYIIDNMNMLNPETFESSQFYILLAGMIVVAIAGAAAGTFFGRNTESVLLSTLTLPLAGLFLLMGWDTILIFQKLMIINTMLGVMIGAPLMFGWVFTVVEYIRGKD